MTRSLGIALFGPPRFTQDGVAIHSFESRKAMVMCAYLIVHDIPVPRRQLGHLFWPNQPATRARGNLRRVVHNLTTLLPGCVLAERHTVQFNPVMGRAVDVHAFADLLAQGTNTALAAAAALYRGAFLDGVCLDDCPDIEDWLQQQRAWWQQRALAVLGQLVEQYRTQQDAAAALGVLAHMLQLDPWREEAHRSMMEVLSMSGQRDAAVAHYQAYAQRLHAARGSVPADATRALFEHLHSGETGYELPAPRHAIPTPPTALLGRAAERTQIAHVLTQPHCRLLTLTGPGGTGKTHLALVVLADILSRFADGVWFIDLAPVSDPALVAPTILQVLGVPQRANIAPQQHLISWLRDRQLVLCLDNFEHVLDAALLVSDLLTECPRIKVLVTSRATLDLRSEQSVPIAPLALPDMGRLARQPGNRVATLRESPAAVLLEARVTDVLPTFALTETNAPTVAALCMRLDGLPLAIELAAPLLRLFALDTVLDQLDQHLAVLAVGQRDHPVRHKGIHATIDWSYQLLDAPTQALFVRLGVFVGGWTLADAEALWNTTYSLTPMQPFAVATGLATLLAHSLIQHQPGAQGGVRFAMLETIRTYTHVQRATQGITTAVQRQHCVIYHAFAQTAQPHVRHEGQSAWIARLADEQHNLRAALTWMYQHEVIADMVQMAIALRLFWLYHGHQREGRRWLEAGLARAAMADVPVSVQGAAWHAAGTLATWDADFASAQAAFEQSLAMFRRLGAVADSAQVQYDLGNALMMQGQYADAERVITEAMDLARASNDDHKYQHAIGRLGACAALRGDSATAIPLLQQILGPARQHGDVHAIALGLAFLGQAYLHTHDTRAADACYRESLQVFQGSQGPQFLSFPLLGMAHLSMSRGATHQATMLLSAIATIHDRLGISLVPALQPWYAQLLDQARTMLTADDYDQVWVRGEHCSPQQAIAYALDATPEPSPYELAHHVTPARAPVATQGSRGARPIPGTPDQLSPREAEVLQLMMDGASNREIAAALMISDATARTHVAHILQKLGVHSRARAIARARDLA